MFPDPDQQPHDLGDPPAQIVFEADALPYACWSCPRTFTTNAALTVHQNSCTNLKRTLDDALQAFAAQARKKRRVQDGDPTDGTTSSGAGQGPILPI